MGIWWRYDMGYNGDIIGIHHQRSDVGTMIHDNDEVMNNDCLGYWAILWDVHRTTTGINGFFLPRNGCITGYTGIECRYNRDIISLTNLICYLGVSEVGSDKSSHIQWQFQWWKWWNSGFLGSLFGGFHRGIPSHHPSHSGSFPKKNHRAIGDPPGLRKPPFGENLGGWFHRFPLSLSDFGDFSGTTSA